MAEIGKDRKRKRAEEEQRDTARRRNQDRERQAQDMWPEEIAQGRQAREQMDTQMHEVHRIGYVMEVPPQTLQFRFWPPNEV